MILCSQEVARTHSDGFTEVLPLLCAGTLYWIAALTQDTQRTRKQVAEAGGVSINALGKMIRKLMVVEDLVPEEYLMDIIEAGG